MEVFVAKQLHRVDSSACCCVDLIELNALPMDVDIPTAEGLDCIMIAVDSGAGASVMNPKTAPNYPVTESEGSRRGVKYVGPGGERIANEGKQKVGFMLKGGQCSQITFNSAKVRKPLLAVSSVCDKGNITIFTPSGSWIIPMDAKLLAEFLAFVAKFAGKIELIRENGVYHLPAWILPMQSPASSRPFGRQDA